MRPQQNRRMRGRGNNNNNNNNNRKGPNPLTRSYESNGPDVKIRGTAQQIAEKYSVLARDAQSSGDRVMAENYLQHAEHYNRIIMTAQAQQQAQMPRERNDEDMSDDRDDGDGESYGDQPFQQANGSGPQPVIAGTPAEVALTGEQPSQPQPEAQGEADGDGNEAGPRRPRRPRRGGQRRGAEAEQASGQAEDPVPEAAQ
jgi:hypothetical protein